MTQHSQDTRVEDGDTHRAAARDSLFLSGAFEHADMAAPEQVRVRNLSAGGLMAEYDEPLALGTAVTITLRGIGKVSGKIAWCTAGRVGIAFDREVNPRLARKPVGKGASTPSYVKPVLPRR